ncbi:hypothetical protein M422DRAFT_256932 [Sphaerobolus stellatus SS14]|uniref:Uncharacterized protein n=1 Tax=Sphaerobolus stellatus (strain SS14) TaxID=990650 RepID=A0A0C9UYZ9_SPHS4|nr:hypothetical protein M422DRAFT_256932 [Sphaerobolus stellatus SS14]
MRRRRISHSFSGAITARMDAPPAIPVSSDASANTSTEGGNSTGHGTFCLSPVGEAEMVACSTNEAQSTSSSSTATSTTLEESLVASTLASSQDSSATTLSEGTSIISTTSSIETQSTDNATSSTSGSAPLSTPTVTPFDPSDPSSPSGNVTMATTTVSLPGNRISGGFSTTSDPTPTACLASSTLKGCIGPASGSGMTSSISSTTTTTTTTGKPGNPIFVSPHSPHTPFRIHSKTSSLPPVFPVPTKGKPFRITASSAVPVLIDSVPQDSQIFSPSQSGTFPINDLPTQSPDTSEPITPAPISIAPSGSQVATTSISKGPESSSRSTASSETQPTIVHLPTSPLTPSSTSGSGNNIGNGQSTSLSTILPASTQSHTSSPAGFFRDTARVAGTFIGTGIILAAALAGVVVLLVRIRRRRLREQRGLRLIEPDINEAASMHSNDTTRTHMRQASLVSNFRSMWSRNSTVPPMPDFDLTEHSSAHPMLPPDAAGLSPYGSARLSWSFPSNRSSSPVDPVDPFVQSDKGSDSRPATPFYFTQNPDGGTPDQILADPNTHAAVRWMSAQ